jgi:hypothetical protein
MEMALEYIMYKEKDAEGGEGGMSWMYVVLVREPGCWTFGSRKSSWEKGKTEGSLAFGHHGGIGTRLTSSTITES